MGGKQQPNRRTNLGISRNEPSGLSLAERKVKATMDELQLSTASLPRYTRMLNSRLVAGKESDTHGHGYGLDSADTENMYPTPRGAAISGMDI